MNVCVGMCVVLYNPHIIYVKYYGMIQMRHTCICLYAYVFYVYVYMNDHRNLIPSIAPFLSFLYNHSRKFKEVIFNFFLIFNFPRFLGGTGGIRLHE